MKFRIGYRTLKTAVGVGIAISLAEFFQFENYSSAGILTLLCIQVTKKRSLVSAWERFFAALVGMLFAFLFFEFLGYNPVVIGLLLLFFIPTTVILKVSKGIVTSGVIIFHFYFNEEFTLLFLMNEVGITVVGIGVALLMNLYMPSLEGDLSEHQQDVENNLRRIFEEISVYLRHGDNLWDGKELTIMDRLIQEGKDLAFKNVENHFLRYEDKYYHYFKMREKQLEIIERMILLVSSLSVSSKHAEMIAEFIDEISEAVHPGNTAHIYLDKLEELREEFREMPLPGSREEFEIRASLFHLLHEIEQYLLLKKQFKKSDDVLKEGR